MARRLIQEPEQAQRGDPIGGTEFRHPAYAQISATRTTGNAVLYGSDFVHHQSIRIQIAKSRLTRSLSNDWLSADSLPYIEVELSEAQWASFVSSMNVGSGTSCTLRYFNKEEIAGLPDPVSRTDTFSTEAGETMREALAALDELRAEIKASGLSGKKADALLRKTDAARQHISGNMQFVGDQFVEHMEKVTEAAKVEVNAYAVNTLMRAGLVALTDGRPVIELLTEPGKPVSASQPSPMSETA